MRRIVKTGFIMVMLCLCCGMVGAEPLPYSAQEERHTHVSADADFYAQCFEHARQNMSDPDRSDPQAVYRQQAEYASAMPESVRKRMAKANQLWGLADDTAIPREDALMIGYAALDAGGYVQREQLHKYYADAWYNISDPQRHIWQVHLRLANAYAAEEGASQTRIVYVDARTGDVLEIRKP